MRRLGSAHVWLGGHLAGQAPLGTGSCMVARVAHGGEGASALQCRRQALGWQTPGTKCFGQVCGGAFRAQRQGLGLWQVRKRDPLVLINVWESIVLAAPDRGGWRKPLDQFQNLSMMAVQVPAEDGLVMGDAVA